MAGGKNFPDNIIFLEKTHKVFHNRCSVRTRMIGWRWASKYGVLVFEVLRWGADTFHVGMIITRSVRHFILILLFDGGVKCPGGF
jgi:hypothetical protein